MENRAKGFHKALTLSDKESWKKFILENYTKTLIEKPMKARVASDGSGGARDGNLSH